MPYFEIVRTRGGYRAHFWSGGNLVWWTAVFARKASAADAIRAFKQHAVDAPVYDRAAVA